MSEEKMFESASRMKLRFNTQQGIINVEDLWDLSLESKSNVSLNGIAKSLNRKIKEADEEDFVSVRSNKNVELDLKFKMVKYVISVRLEENKNVRDKALIKAQRERILEIKEKRQNADLEGKSVEELDAMLAELG